MKDFLPLLGRFGISLIFVVNGLYKALEFNESVELLQSKFLPFTAVLITISIVIELLGGLLIVIGYKVKVTASAMSVYLLITTVVFHPVWKDMENFMDFSKNLAIIGGLCLLAYYGSGPKSIDLVGD